MKQKPTESVILDAAMRVFTRKGFAATRTEEIAKEAGMNRALLHYYYRDKQTIFNLIFERRFSEFFKGLFIIFETDSPLFEKIEKMVDHEISTISQHPDLPRFILMEVAQHPERLIEYGQKLGLNPRIFLEQFEGQVQAEVRAGRIRPIEGRQLVINIMSLCMYPFVAKPIIKTMMQLDESKYFEMQERRKKEVYEFIIHAIKVSV
ncbi:MAG: TetR/AcrR family transcriptional regulator [Cyclobacteriaceae bacterium]|nr:TetR/AcrR family transcriptional regulator [Cyclobacteriaceae bacterium]